MIREALELLMDCAVQAKSPELLRAGELEDVYYVNGSIEGVNKRMKGRFSTVHDLATLALFDDESAECWFDDSTIQLVRNSKNMEFADKWALPLCDDTCFAFFSNSYFMSQRVLLSGLVGECKQEIANAMPGLIDLFRQLKFETNSEKHAEVDVNRDKMGRSISKEVTGAGVIPESFVVSMRRWAEFEILTSLEIMVEFDFAECKIRLRPTASSIAESRRHCGDELRDLIGEHISQALICHGSP